MTDTRKPSLILGHAQYGRRSSAVQQNGHATLWTRRAGMSIVAFATMTGAVGLKSAPAMEREEAVRLSREYLDSANKEERRVLRQRLNAYEGDLAPVLEDLATGRFKQVKPGYLPKKRFSVPELREKRPQDLLYFTVPKSYRPERPTGLIVFLHGGGAKTSRRAPKWFMDFPDEGDEDSSALGDLFDATAMIAVGPSAPWNERCWYRWCLRESDDYLADVVRECKSRFNIDPERVFLLGHSMGGFGAYHHVLRNPDRYAAVVVNAGSWSLAHWPAVRGTPLCIVQGVHDAAPGERWHYTDIAYARFTDKLLSSRNLDFTYHEHNGGHGVSEGKKHIARYFEGAGQVRRDPFARHITLASPLGFDENYCFPVKHNRWLTLDESTGGELEYDELVENDAEDFDAWRLTHRTTRSEGASIDAVNRGDNTIVFTTQNVARFTVWLHPSMIDVSKPVTLLVNGKPRFTGNVVPTLATALDSYERKLDWGLVYPIKLTLKVPRRAVMTEARD